jgi:cell pole-organizing protein PopZ
MEGFTKLTSHMALDREGTGAVTIEDIMKEMLRPMLREWLDANLPQVIEKLVQKELDQIARKAMEE